MGAAHITFGFPGRGFFRRYHMLMLSTGVYLSHLSLVINVIYIFSIHRACWMNYLSLWWNPSREVHALQYMYGDRGCSHEILILNMMEIQVREKFDREMRDFISCSRLIHLLIRTEYPGTDWEICTNLMCQRMTWYWYTVCILDQW